MPQYTAPGVYVEEVASSVQPIAGVGTSTAGFLGLVASDVDMPPRPGQFTVVDGEQVPVLYDVAPLGQPTLVTSWEEFKNQFGDFQAGNAVLAHAVYGFFNNGGTRCWVARVVEVGTANTDDSDDENDRTTANQYRDALERFEAIDEIALVAAPGIEDDGIVADVVAHCERMGDRFAILDGAADPDNIVTADVNAAGANSNYAAMYFPYIQVFDPVTNGPAFVPPSGHVAGIFARVDSERGVHKAPANETVRGATGVQVRVSRNQQGPLNEDGINVIRDINGSFKVWGARTLGGADKPEWTYINVRRLFLFLRESIDEGTGWVVFEPNTPQLWARISRNVTAFLTTVWRNGALFGNTPGEAFYVKCDASTNPPETRELGQVICEIGVSVARPAEFVIFRISQWAGPGA